MNTLALTLTRVVLLGIGATLTFDLWGLFLKHTFKIPPSNICLVGRWLRYMPDGVYRHANITASTRKRAECQVGWMAHYLKGVTFAGIFVAIMGVQWLEQPTLVPTIIFGCITVLAPFMIMQPSFGFGIAASKSVNLVQARMRTLMNHVAFGLGLFFFGWMISWLSLGPLSLYIFLMPGIYYGPLSRVLKTVIGVSCRTRGIGDPFWLKWPDNYGFISIYLLKIWSYNAMRSVIFRLR